MEPLNQMPVTGDDKVESLASPRNRIRQAMAIDAEVEKDVRRTLALNTFCGCIK